MYEAHFNLNRKPFDNYSADGIFTLNDEFESTLERIEQILLSRCAVGVITGGPGVGKTTIVSAAAKRVEDRFASAEEVAELLKRCLAHVEQPITFALPDECQGDEMYRRAATDETQTRSAYHRFSQLALIVLAVVIIVVALIAGHGLLPKEAVQSEIDVAKSAPAGTTPLQSSHPDDDPAVAWDGTAGEISQMVQDARPFESRAQQHWDTLPTDSAFMPNSGSTTTSAQESKP